MQEPARERVVVAASGFTSLWALTWLGASAVGASTAVTGGFAVGGVMAGSGLTMLWWKTARMRSLHAKAEAAAHRHEQDDEQPAASGAHAVETLTEPEEAAP